MSKQTALATIEPEKFVVGEWVDFRERIGVNLWEGRPARVTKVNGLEVYVDLDGNVNEPMAFFPRRYDGKHVRMFSKNGPVPDYEFAPTWIYHGKISESFTRLLEKARIKNENKPQQSVLDLLRIVLGNL